MYKIIHMHLSREIFKYIINIIFSLESQIIIIQKPHRKRFGQLMTFVHRKYTGIPIT